MSKRSVASATITFGLVSIPVKLYVTASPDNVNFNFITSEGNRVKQQLVDSVSGDVVERHSLKKGYEHTKNQYVFFDNDELRALEDGDKGLMSITEFVDVNSFNIQRVEKSYYLDADKGGDRPYRLLVAALLERKKVAVAQWTNRGRQHLVVVKVEGAALVVHQLFYDTEMRDFELDCATYTPRDAEVDMACKFIDAMSSESFDTSKYTNTYNERILNAVQQKLSGESISIESVPQRTTLELFDALKKSLSEIKTKKTQAKSQKKKPVKSRKK